MCYVISFQQMNSPLLFFLPYACTICLWGWTKTYLTNNVHLLTSWRIFHMDHKTMLWWWDLLRSSLSAQKNIKHGHFWVFIIIIAATLAEWPFSLWLVTKHLEPLNRITMETALRWSPVSSPHFLTRFSGLTQTHLRTPKHTHQQQLRPLHQPQASAWLYISKLWVQHKHSTSLS